MSDYIPDCKVIPSHALALHFARKDGLVPKTCPVCQKTYRVEPEMMQGALAKAGQCEDCYLAQEAARDML